ncbi:probable cytochrome P450 6g2 [Ctenocephalides felis]|uniref:probable cytochrome P450 6g2 n=1 Tax=Ctenocephalides felis TaxID=7515 RepID=UPI000E6E49B5|nr:probable cytochrome P450 6g2 [Ctenocephalides felis]
MFQDRVSSTDGHTDALGSRNLFRIKNPLWKEMRVKLTPIFSTAKMKSMFPLITQVGEEFNEFMNTTLKNRNIDNMRDLCAKYTTDVITSCAFGIQANSFKNPDAEFRTVGKRIFAAEYKRAIEISAFFFFPEVVSILGFKLFEKYGTKFLRQSFNEVLGERIKSGTSRHDLVDMLIDLKNNEAASGSLKFEGDTLVAQAAVFFAAGYEASSGAMSFTLYEIALQPEIQHRLRAEILEKINEHGGITYEAIKEMKYLDMVLSETLRKYPTLPFLDRMCTSRYRLPPPYDHVVLEPKTPIYLSILAIHMDPKYYPNPDKFDPERFSEDMKQNRNPYTYMPFGAGPHNCIGERFGLLQTKVGLAYILKDFHFTPCEKTRVPLQLDSKAMFLAPKGGIHLQFERI